MARIFELFHGYSEKLDDGTMKANCSSTLIKASKNIIVDTMTAWDKEKLIQALAIHQVTPDEIDYVVCTHNHPDHIGNNNLFLNAEHIIGTCVHRGELFFEKKFQNGRYEICPGVEVVATPGHTADDVTVFVRLESKRFAITGDLFEKEEDIMDPQIWKELGNEELQKTQSSNRDDVISKADCIIPGHGPWFDVTEEMRKIVKSQVIT